MRHSHRQSRWPAAPDQPATATRRGPACSWLRRPGRGRTARQPALAGPGVRPWPARPLPRVESGPDPRRAGVRPPPAYELAPAHVDGRLPSHARPVRQQPAGVQKPPRQGAQRILVGGRPLQRLRQPRASIKRFGVLPVSLPLACCFVQPPLDMQALPAGIQPLAQRWPFTDQAPRGTPRPRPGRWSPAGHRPAPSIPSLRTKPSRSVE